MKKVLLFEYFESQLVKVKVTKLSEGIKDEVSKLGH